MKIAIDLSQLNVDGAGVNNYLKGVLLALTHQDNHDFVLCMRKAEQLGFDLPENFSIQIIPNVPKWRGGGLTWYWLLGKRLRSLEVDILLEVTMNTAALFFPTVQVVHDLAPVTHPHTATFSLRWRFWLSLLVARFFATKIAALTSTTKETFLRYFPRYQKEILVTNAGLAAWTQQPVDEQEQRRVKQKLGLPKNFFLSLGTVQPRKNYQNTVMAFANAIKSKEISARFNYVIGGGRGWFYQQILAQAEDLGVQNKVHFLGFVDEEDLPHIFDQAAGFVQTSIEEGFGLPLIEARARSLPIMCSDIPVFRQIEFDANPIFVDPNDQESMSAGLAELAGQEKIPPSEALLKNYSWEKVAKRIIGFIESDE